MLRRLVHLFAIGALLVSCKSTIPPDQTAMLEPGKPSVDEKITLYYNPAAKEAVLKDAHELVAQILVLHYPEMPRLYEIPMRKTEKSWQSELHLEETNAQLLLYRFSAEGRIDDRGGNCWHTLIYKDGKPVRGSQYALASLYRQGEYADFKITGTPQLVRNELANEIQLYPDHVEANIMLWNLRLREKRTDSTKNVIKNQLEKVYTANENNEEAVMMLLNFFYQTDQKDRGDAIKKEWLSKAPQGKMSLNDRRRRVSQTKDPQLKIAMLDSILAEIVLSDKEKQSMRALLVYAYVDAGQVDKAEAVLTQMENPSGNMYNNLAWPLIDKGEKLEQAISMAKRGVDLLRKPDIRQKPPYMSEAEWRKNSDQNLAMILDTYALGLCKVGQFKEAETAYAEAYQKNQGKSEEVNSRLVTCLVKNGKYTEALQIAEKCLAENKANDELVVQYKTAWTKVNGATTGYIEKLKKLTEQGRQKTLQELTEKRMNKPAPDFSLKSLEGRTVKLAEQKGKVVVVDFWATWCGPCKESFPFLQKVYEQYQNNSNVLILALNTWEREEGAKRVANVEKFIKDNRYTFPVLYDENFVEKYGVTGIPTKFILDKKGLIAFQTIGFDDGDEMIKEMTLEIDLLLNE